MLYSATFDNGPTRKQLEKFTETFLLQKKTFLVFHYLPWHTTQTSNATELVVHDEEALDDGTQEIS